MPGGLDTTFRVLAESHNDAATVVLLRLLDGAATAPDGGQNLRRRALQTLVHRPEIGARLAVLQRWPGLDAEDRTLLREERGRLTQAISETLLAGDPKITPIACEALVALDEYEQFPLLAQLATDPNYGRAAVVANTLRQLADRLFNHATGPRDYTDRRDLARIRTHIAETLERSIGTFTSHRQPAVLEAFLSLAHRGNTTLRKVLRDPRDPVFETVTHLMEFSQLAGIMDLTLSFLEDPSPPSTALRIISSRCDRPFLTSFTSKFQASMSHLARENLRRIDHIVWLGTDYAVIDDLDEAAQAGAVQLAAASGMHRDEVLDLFDHVLSHGNVGGRRAASRATTHFDGPIATQILRKSLEDRDPQVQANVLAHLRPRNVTGALATLITMVDSPHEQVRQAARDGLSEFNFERFLHSFDSLDEDARRTTGELVKKVDPTSMANLAEELRAMSRTRRIRGLAVVEAMDAALEMEPAMIELLADDDHVVRAAAVQAMGTCPTAAARDALRTALFDRSIIVQQAAESSLERLAETIRQKQLEFATGPRQHSTDRHDQEVVERTYVIDQSRFANLAVTPSVQGTTFALPVSSGASDTASGADEVSPC